MRLAMTRSTYALVCSGLPDAVVPLHMVEGENPADAAPYVFASDVPDSIPPAKQVIGFDHII